MLPSFMYESTYMYLLVCQCLRMCLLPVIRIRSLTLLLIICIRVFCCTNTVVDTYMLFYVLLLWLLVLVRIGVLPLSLTLFTYTCTYTPHYTRLILIRFMFVFHFKVLVYAYWFFLHIIRVLFIHIPTLLRQLHV